MKANNVLSPAVLGGIKRLSMRYTLPEKCAITRDDLVQEACRGLLEAQIAHPEADVRTLLNYARKAMQKAISRYVSPVTRSLDTPISLSPSGEREQGREATLADTIADDSDFSLALFGERVPDLSGEIGAYLAYIAQLDSLLAAGTITPANYRKKKQRFLHKLRRQMSQNLS